jgi:hypothetical protein
MRRCEFVSTRRQAHAWAKQCRIALGTQEEQWDLGLRGCALAGRLGASTACSAAYRCVVLLSRFLGRLMIWMASKGHFLTQMPQPMQSSSERKATLLVGSTSMQSFPMRTTGHCRLHCRNRGVSTSTHVSHFHSQPVVKASD